jgi:murein peptide amidase A
VLRLLAVAAALAVPLGPPVERELAGRSAEGRAIQLYRTGLPTARFRVLVVGCIHGDECAGTAVTRRLLRTGAPVGVRILVVQNLNPDGFVRGVRQNARGVDLNRNFGSEWRRLGRRWSPQYAGPRPWSEPETRLARTLVERLRPDVTIWFHQPQGLVRAWGPSVPIARRYARLAGMRFARLQRPPGAATAWQAGAMPASRSFVVELAPGELGLREADPYVRAILRLRPR